MRILLLLSLAAVSCAAQSATYDPERVFHYGANQFDGQRFVLTAQSLEIDEEVRDLLVSDVPGDSRICIELPFGRIECRSFQELRQWMSQ